MQYPRNESCYGRQIRTTEVCLHRMVDTHVAIFHNRLIFVQVS